MQQCGVMTVLYTQSYLFSSPTPLIPGPLNLCSFKRLIIGAQTPLPCFLNFSAPVVKVVYLVH
jgi:hypothetical protein